MNAGSGIPAFTYDWLGPNLFSSNISNIYNLYAGDYNLIIIDANGCFFGIKRCMIWLDCCVL